MQKKIVYVALLLGSMFAVIRGQTASDGEYTEMVESSEVIVIAKLKNILPIVDKEKINQRSNPDSLPNPIEYTLGIEYVLEVSEWIKAKPDMQKTDVIRIFFKGGVPTENDATLVKDREYLLFLNRLEKIDFKSAFVFDYLSKDSLLENEFNPKNYFIIFGGQTEAVSDKDKIKEVSDNIRNSLKNHKIDKKSN